MQTPVVSTPTGESEVEKEAQKLRASLSEFVKDGKTVRKLVVKDGSFTNASMTAMATLAEDLRMDGTPLTEVEINEGVTVKVTDYSDLSRLTDVEYLGLLNEGFNNDALLYVGRLTGLKRLALGHADINKIGLDHLGQLKQLTDISLEGIYDTIAEDLNFVRNLENLHGLYLSSRLMQDDDLESLAGLVPNLQALTLKKANVTGKGLASLSRLKNLVILNISESQMSDDKGLDFINSLTNLTELNVVDTDITEAGLARYRRDGLKIHYGDPEKEQIFAGK